MKKKLYTNGAYTVLGKKIRTYKKSSPYRIVGKIVSTKYPHVYAIGEEVSFPAEKFMEVEQKKHVRVVVEEEDCTWSYPVKCPWWLMKLLEWHEDK